MSLHLSFQKKGICLGQKVLTHRRRLVHLDRFARRIYETWPGNMDNTSREEQSER